MLAMHRLQHGTSQQSIKGPTALLENMTSSHCFHGAISLVTEFILDRRHQTKRMLHVTGQRFVYYCAMLRQCVNAFSVHHWGVHSTWYPCT